jgi:uncharacterized protein YecE (DUF72 family)
MIHIGTSGWQYEDWRGRFYPDDVPERAWLEYFAERFTTVEVNNSFYRLPSREVVVGWRRATPAGFVAAVKASRYLTHIRRLREPKQPVSLLWDRARRLGSRLGPILFQLPPNLQVETERLDQLLRALPERMRPAFEFRHASWNTQEVHRMLDRAGAAIVWADRPGARADLPVTGGWRYIRFHQGTRDAPGYRRSKLQRWADRLASAPEQETFVYFNNDAGGAAVRDAHTLARLLEQRGLHVARPLMKTE